MAVLSLNLRRTASALAAGGQAGLCRQVGSRQRVTAELLSPRQFLRVAPIFRMKEFFSGFLNTPPIGRIVQR